MHSRSIKLAVALATVVCHLPSVMADEGKKTVEREVHMEAMELTSPAFKQGETIPAKYTCDGQDVSPDLSWSKAPQGTKELVLICDDPDAPMGTWVHWVLYGLPADTTSLPEGMPSTKLLESGGKQGKNDFGKIGYGGPCPPKGPAHRYFFKLYAIDTTLELDAGATKKEVMKAIEGHIIAEGELMGNYQR